MNSQVFLEYTRRFEQIMQSFPESHWRSRLNLDAEPPEVNSALSLSVLRYLNLCSEEFYLYKRGYLARDVWTIWERELQRTLGTPLLRREWGILEGEFESYPEFRAFVHRVHNEKETAYSREN